MAVILSALLFLFGAPALLLWTGRLIQRIGRPRRPASPTSRTPADAWYYRPVQPIFGEGSQEASHGQAAPAPASQPGDPQLGNPQPGDSWYQRPAKPVFARPSWLRRPTFAGHRTD